VSGRVSESASQRVSESASQRVSEIEMYSIQTLSLQTTTSDNCGEYNCIEAIHTTLTVKVS